MGRSRAAASRDSDGLDVRVSGPQLACRTAVAVVGLAVLALALGVAGPGGASVPDGAFQTNDTNDTEEPTIGNLTRVNVTELELEVHDDVDVDESSIDSGDFELSHGTLLNVTTTEDGANATATLNLVSALDRDDVTVSIDENATIADDVGYELDPGDAPSLTVDGMDGVAPSVYSLTVDNETAGTLDVEVRATEPLGELFVGVNGPDSQVLALEDFSTAAGIATYEATVEPDEAGEYRVRLTELTDEHNNTQAVSIHESVVVDGTPPDAVAGVDFARSEGLVFTFDASRTTDETAIRNFSWDFGDGSGGTGERVSHRFEPGNYTVTLSATDTHGNTGTDSLVLNLTDRNGSLDAAELLGLNEVSISGSSAGGSAVVDVPVAPADESIHLERTNGDPIVTAQSVTLESMTVTLSRNSTYSLGVQLEGPGGVGDAAAAVNDTVIAGLTLVHDVPDTRVENATLTIGIERQTPNETIEADVYRFHNRSWNRLETEAIDGTNGTARFRVDSPGLSRFAVTRESPPSTDSNATTNATTNATGTPTASPTPAAPVGVTDASLNATAVDQNATVNVSATVRNRQNETADFTAGLTVDGAVVQTESLSIPPGETRTATFTYGPAEPGSYAVAVNGTTAGTLEVGGGASSAGLLAVFGFLPLGLFQALLTYVGGVLVAVFLALKAAALYLGY